MSINYTNYIAFQSAPTSLAVNVPAGTKAMFIALGSPVPYGGTWTSLTVNGGSNIIASYLVEGTNNGWGSVRWYQIDNPPTGSYNITSSQGNGNQNCIAVICFDTPVTLIATGTGNGNNNAPNTFNEQTSNITGILAGDYVLSTVFDDLFSATFNSQTGTSVYYDPSNSSQDSLWGVQYQVATGTSVQPGWNITDTGNGDWSVAAVVVRELAGGPPHTRKFGPGADLIFHNPR